MDQQQAKLSRRKFLRTSGAGLSKNWTGFASTEERFADEYVGQRIQPFWIGGEARKLYDTNFIRRRCA